VSAVATHSSVDHPLTSEAETIRRTAVVIFSSDRGLAGAFNSQVIREGLEQGERLRELGREPVYYLVGRKAVGYFQFRRIESAAEWIGDTDTPSFHTAEEIAHTLQQAFLRGGESEGVDEIVLVYNRFVSMMTQEPTALRLLPLEIEEAEDTATAAVYPLYEFEPDAGTVLDAILPVYIQSRVFNALLQSSAAKQAATQKAMKSASDNADKLITDYTRLRNNARQAEITQQIAEIVGGADALASS
jgi:F-type H+-transporting ATPase subunit gamma